MASEGPRSPGSAVNDASSGSVAWASPGNVSASDNAYSAAVCSAQSPQRLGAYNFGFSIPDGATIDGFVVEVERKSASGTETLTSALALSKAADGTFGLSGNRDLVFTTTEGYASYGGPTDKWGLTISPAEVNASGFGVVVAPFTTHSDTLSIDHIRVTVHYTEAEPQLASDDGGHIVVRRARAKAQSGWQGVMRAAYDSFSLVKLANLPADLTRELQWANGGTVELERDVRWALGGRAFIERTLLWQVAPSPLRIEYALTGRAGPVVYTFRFERRTRTNQFLADVTPAIIGAEIDANNDRAIFRTARFSIDATAQDDRGNAIEVNPLSDHIAVFMDLLVDGNYLQPLPMGLYALNVPTETYRPGEHLRDVMANDNCIHLLEDTTSAAYTVAAAANFLTGTGAVVDILNSMGLLHALPSTSLVLAADRTWPPGTPWLTVVNDLLAGANMYQLAFDANGIAKTRERIDLASRTPDVQYSGDDFVLIPIREEVETTRLANRVIAVVDDPNRAPLSSVAVNADPDSPISTVTLGRTITKVIQADTAADQTTLDEIARNYLQRETGLYRRAALVTSIDPRREANEIYEVTAEGVYAAERWWARNWRVQLAIGAQMTHTLGKVERIGL